MNDILGDARPNKAEIHRCSILYVFNEHDIPAQNQFGANCLIQLMVSGLACLRYDVLPTDILIIINTCRVHAELLSLVDTVRMWSEAKY